MSIALRSLGITTPVIHTVMATPVVSAVITVVDITMGVGATTTHTHITEAQVDGEST